MVVFILVDFWKNGFKALIEEGVFTLYGEEEYLSDAPQALQNKKKADMNTIHISFQTKVNE